MGKSLFLPSYFLHIKAKNWLYTSMELFLAKGREIDRGAARELLTFECEYVFDAFGIFWT